MSGGSRYRHSSAADWYGAYDNNTHSYHAFNESHIQHALQVIDVIIDTLGAHENIVALEPVNEPWYPIPMDHLQHFYWLVYQKIQQRIPRWITLFHDSFRFDPFLWNGFMTDCDGFGLDTHIYQAWSDVMPPWKYQSAACNQQLDIERIESMGIPVVVGEWSLATDNCAMWLNGFNDNLPGYPLRTCQRVPCPPSYVEVDVLEEWNGQEEVLDIDLHDNQTEFSEIPKSVELEPIHRTKPMGPFGSGA